MCEVEVSTGCGMARGGAVAPAVVRRAEVRAALHAPCAGCRAGRWPDRSSAARRRAGSPARSRRRSPARRGAVPVGGPLPDVADHVVEAVAVRREGADRRGALEAVGARLCEGKSPCQVLAMQRPVRRQLVAPGVVGAVEPAAGGELPLGLGRQRPCPPRRRRPRRRHRRRGPPDGRSGRSSRAARAQRMPPVARRHVSPTTGRSRRRSTGAAVGANTDASRRQRARVGMPG